MATSTGSLPARVDVVEVGPRDGLQNHSAVVATPVKVGLIKHAVEAGLRRIEVTSFVHPAKVPHMADAEEVVAAALPYRDGARFIGLVLNRHGLDRAATAGVDEVNFAVPATESFSGHNQGMSVDEAVREWDHVARLAGRHGVVPTATIGVAFGCPYEGEVSQARVMELCRRLADTGAAEIALADTIGVAVPNQVASMVAAVRGVVGDVPLRCHLHNTRNTGYANAYAALQSGVEALDASIGGLGGCPFAPGASGNIASEDLLAMLDRMNVATGVRTSAVIESAGWLGEQLEIELPAHVGKAPAFPPPLDLTDPTPPG